MKSENSTVQIKFDDLVFAFECVSSGTPFENRAYINIDTGKIILLLEDVEVESDVPDDLDDPDKYIAVPDKNELNLGSKLVFAFMAAVLPDSYDTVAAFFRKKGAYGRFKGFLESQNMLEQWYAFEESATEQALNRWCREHGIKITT
jgi:Uncharacterised protein family (UPF0158)